VSAIARSDCGWHGVPERTAGLVTVGAQIGYALGILFVLPLTDVITSRRLVRTVLVLTTLFLLTAAFSPTTPVLIAASVPVTATTVIPQILIRSYLASLLLSTGGGLSAHCRPA
jgi:MFS family permease